jgi:hypothetical protein
MVIDLSTHLEDELRRLAGLWGKDVEALVEEAVRQYLDAAAITDVSSDDVAATQASLMSELGHISAWSDGQEPAADEAR